VVERGYPRNGAEMQHGNTPGIVGEIRLPNPTTTRDNSNQTTAAATGEEGEHSMSGKRRLSALAGQQGAGVRHACRWKRVGGSGVGVGAGG